jgi:hypothetical protein
MVGGGGGLAPAHSSLSSTWARVRSTQKKLRLNRQSKLFPASQTPKLSFFSDQVIKPWVSCDYLVKQQYSYWNHLAWSNDEPGPLISYSLWAVSSFLFSSCLHVQYRKKRRKCAVKLWVVVVRRLHICLLMIFFLAKVMLVHNHNY